MIQRCSEQPDHSSQMQVEMGGMGAIENPITQSTLTADHVHPYNLLCTCQLF